jgi:hypothetical protein
MRHIWFLNDTDQNLNSLPQAPPVQRGRKPSNHRQVRCSFCFWTEPHRPRSPVAATASSGVAADPPRRRHGNDDGGSGAHHASLPSALLRQVSVGPAARRRRRPAARLRVLSADHADVAPTTPGEHPPPSCWAPLLLRDPLLACSAGGRAGLDLSLWFEFLGARNCLSGNCVLPFGADVSC